MATCAVATVTENGKAFQALSDRDIVAARVAILQLIRGGTATATLISAAKAWAGVSDAELLRAQVAILMLGEAITTEYTNALPFCGLSDRDLQIAQLYLLFSQPEAPLSGLTLADIMTSAKELAGMSHRQLMEAETEMLRIHLAYSLTVAQVLSSTGKYAGMSSRDMELVKLQQYCDFQNVIN